MWCEIVETYFLLRLLGNVHASPDLVVRSVVREVRQLSGVSENLWCHHGYCLAAEEETV